MGRSERDRMRLVPQLLPLLVVTKLAFITCNEVASLDMESVEESGGRRGATLKPLPKTVDGISVAKLRQAVHKAVVKAVAARRAKFKASKKTLVSKVQKAAKKVKAKKKGQAKVKAMIKKAARRNPKLKNVLKVWEGSTGDREDGTKGGQESDEKHPS